MSYRDLSDEDKLRAAIEFVAVGHTIPDELVEFLHQEKLYEAVTTPCEIYVETT